ncbi:MAG: hypothetical protein KJ749_10060, partial [Planctomycetes bacterium]|nr:hypothetical protein [Planctomycetota bacterium]
ASGLPQGGLSAADTPPRNLDAIALPGGGHHRCPTSKRGGPPAARIRDEKDFLRYRDYIHLNPVKHGHIENPGDWPWSSFRRHLRMGWLDPNWPGSSPVDLPDIND